MTTLCPDVFTDALGGPPMRCGRALGHSGPHDTIAMPSVMRFLAAAPVPFAWEITTADAVVIDRALELMGRHLWAARGGQAPAVTRDRDHISRLRAALAEARSSIGAT